MKLPTTSGVYSMAVAGRPLARLSIDLRASGDHARDMRHLAQQLRDIADHLDQETQ